jgi:hypothetical protein
VLVIVSSLLYSCKKDELIIPDKIIKQKSVAEIKSDKKVSKKRIRKSRRFWIFKKRKLEEKEVYGNKKLLQ